MTEVTIYSIIEDDYAELKKPTNQFDFSDPIIQPTQLFENLKATLVRSGGLGLSANQCGINASVFVVGNSHDPDSIMIMFNPKIVDEATNFFNIEEGCLSFPGFFMKVKRPSTVRVRYADETGEVYTKSFSGMTARTILHEYDHLNGVVFTSRANRFELTKAKSHRKKMQRAMKKQFT
jgi:peptide deformylase